MSVAANRYAKALIDVLSLEQAETGLNQLSSFSKLLREQTQARQFFENPTVPFDRRKSLARALGTKIGFDPKILNFIDILIERNRLDILDEIIPAYRKVMDEKLGIVRAVVTTAQPLDSAQQSELTAKLASVTGKQVRMEVAVDPTLIGGVVAKVGSTVYDGSVRQQLKAFRSALIER